jgi:pseudouridine synthase
MNARLQKILSQWGIASRRQAELAIVQGRVRVNGIVAELGQTADPDTDTIEVDDKLITRQNRPAALYILVNKPLGVICTCDDPQGRNTVLDLLPKNLRTNEGLHPVGRLDIDSTGALLLTNDGELTNYLTHPRHSISKTYAVWIEGKPTTIDLERWRHGIDLDGRVTLPAGVRIVQKKADRTLLEIVLHEGRNRQIRRVAAALGYRVIHLHRTHIGSIGLDGNPTVEIGNYRYITQSEINQLKQSDTPPTILPHTH